MALMMKQESNGVWTGLGSRRSTLMTQCDPGLRRLQGHERLLRWNGKVPPSQAKLVGPLLTIPTLTSQCAVHPSLISGEQHAETENVGQTRLYARSTV